MISVKPDQAAMTPSMPRARGGTSGLHPELRVIIIKAMQKPMLKYCMLFVAWFAIHSTANAAPSALVSTAKSAWDAAAAVAPPCVQAESNSFSAAAYDDVGFSLPTLKKELGKTFFKAVASRPRPIRLSRLRALSSIFRDNAFLSPDTLLSRDVRLQI